MNFGRSPDDLPRGPAAGLARHPAAGLRLLVLFIKDTALASQIGVFELTFAGKVLNNRASRPCSPSAPCSCFYFLLSYPLSCSATPGETACHTSRSMTSARATAALDGPASGVSLDVEKGEISA